MKNLQTTIFELKATTTPERFSAVNLQLATYNPAYLKRFGTVGSNDWWAHYEAGCISRTLICGQITFVGSRQLGTETEDIVSILTDTGTIEYDREDFWCCKQIRLGVWVTIERIKTKCLTPNGPLTNFIDVKITCDLEDHDRRIRKA